MSWCKKCDHVVMEFDGFLYHYETKKGDELSEACRSCDCKRAE